MEACRRQFQLHQLYGICCRFEGYDAAIASATQGPASSWQGSAELALQQTMSAMRGMLSPRSMSAVSLPAERQSSLTLSPSLSPSTSFLGRISTFGRSEEAAGGPVEEVTFPHWLCTLHMLVSHSQLLGTSGHFWVLSDSMSGVE